MLDVDPKARPKTFKVKVVAQVQPVPPEALPGAPIRPLVLEGWTVPYIADGPWPNIGRSQRCTGPAAPSGRGSVEPALP